MLGILGTVHYVIVLYVTFVYNGNVSWWFFHFCKILIFRDFTGVKEQTTVQNDKKTLSVSDHISGTIRGIKEKKWSRMEKHYVCRTPLSQETYIIWLSFTVEMPKIIVCPGIFVIVKILIFQVAKGLKGQIMDQNDENFCLLHLIFQKP